MKLSTRSRYGLRAVIDLARYGEEGPVPIRNISERQEISEGYLEQIMALLKKAGIVNSIRGINGGYLLAKEAKEVSVGDVLRALEGNLQLVECPAIAGEIGCKVSDSCVTKYVWKKIDESISQTVDHIYIDSLVDESKKTCQ